MNSYTASAVRQCALKCTIVVPQFLVNGVLTAWSIHVYMSLFSVFPTSL